MQMSAYVNASVELRTPYRIADALVIAGIDGDRHKLRRVIVGSQWDARSLLLQAAREAIGARAVNALVLGLTTVAHGPHGDTILDVHAHVGGELIPVGWRRLRDEELRREAQESGALIVDPSLSTSDETLTIEESMTLEGENGATPGCWRQARTEPEQQTRLPPAAKTSEP